MQLYHSVRDLPSAHEIARALPGGKVRADGRIAFQDPFDPKPGKLPCTMWLRADLPDGFTVADVRGKIDAIRLKDATRKLVPALGQFEPRSKNSGNGKARSPAGGPVVREPVAKPGRTGEERANRLFLLPLNKIAVPSRRRDLIKGLIPRVGLTVIYGAPKSGKSFLTMDMAMHVAMGLEYRGRRTQQGPAIYCYFEGQTLAAARIEAFRQRHVAENAPDVPFYLMPVTINLVAEHAALAATIRDSLGTTKPAVIVLDTLNRSFVGSESSDQDMTQYVKAADTLRETFECAVVIVHHCGHDASRPRGHTALIGAADAVIGVRKESVGQFIANLEMMKDGSAGEMLAGRIEQVELGHDEDGDPITSCVIVPVELIPRIAEPKGPKLTPGEKLALKALHYAIGEVGRAPPASNHIPAAAKTVTRDQWREYAWRHGISGSDEERAKRQGFRRAVEGLTAKGICKFWEPFVWIA